MEEKMYNLLEKMYIEVQDIKTDIQDVKTEIGDMKTEMVDMKTDIQGIKTEIGDMKSEIKEIKSTMATKDDLKNFPTKKDFDLLSAELHGEIQGVYDEVVELRNDINAMEIITTKNAFDIAKLKAVR